MEYNNNGKINRYYDLDEILKLDIPDNIRKEFQDKFEKKIFYDYDGSCKVGILIGIEKNEKLSDLYYIIDSNGSKNYISIWKSLTKL